MNRDGSNVRRLTNHPAIDITPTWSPSGTQIAFTSDRTRHAADLHHGRRRPRACSAADVRVLRRPADVVAGAVQRDRVRRAHRARATTSRCSTWRRGEVRQLTFGEGTNESPAFAPNGRHLAFMSTRSGKTQIFTMARDGKNLRQITRTGNNYQPDWSK